MIRQAPSPDIFFSRLCQNLSQPITSSPNNSTDLALNVLTTIFNILPSDQDSRYHVLLATLKIIRSYATFEQLQPQLENLDVWLATWEMEKDESRKLYLAISDVAKDASEAGASYKYMLKALRTLQDGDDARSDEARTLTLKTLRHSLNSPTTFDFQDLTALDSIQALRESEPLWYELLEIFSTETMEEYADFLEANPDFLDSDKTDLNADQLERKIRLLTLTSLAASASQSRTLPYAHISKALRVNPADVEMWAIDVIRAGLVEGKLSQSQQQFLIHRATYRVFGEHQWREVASRLDMWRESLTSVLRVIRDQKEQFVRDKEQELRDAEQTSKGTGYRPNRQQRNAPVAVEVE